MKVLCILASPRKKGNSATIARRFLNVAEDRGATIETYILNELDYRACQACYACKTMLEHCALKDDLTPVLKALGECDLVVVATPVYFSDICAQAKAFIDRTFSFVNPDFKNRPDPTRFVPGKKMLWIITQEDSDEHHNDIFQRYGALFKAYAGFDTHVIRAANVEAPGDVMNRQEIMATAQEMAQMLIR